MDVTTAGRYRVLGRPRDDESLVLVALDDEYEPVAVATGPDDPELDPGTLVDATLSWTNGTARFTDVEVVRETRYHFLSGVTDMFAAARETWREAVSEGEAMNARLTRNTDGDPAGALYVFAKQSGERDLFAEMRAGTTPIEPLVERVNEERGPKARAVFVLCPADEDFVCVYVVFERDGLLARTVRDTYDEDATLDVGGLDLDGVDPDPNDRHR